MANIVMYRTKNCAFCVRAEALLNRKGVKFTTIYVDDDLSLREEMMERSGRRTVPQIFINGEAIGGFDELYALNQTGKLDELLGK